MGGYVHGVTIALGESIQCEGCIIDHEKKNKQEEYYYLVGVNASPTPHP